MKKLIIHIFPVLVLGLLVAGITYAQGNFALVKGEIPFGFIVADKTLPAGNYTLIKVSPELTKIRDSQSHNVLAILTCAVVKGEPVKPMLVFRRYGDQYYLAQIWNGTKGGAEIPKCRKELQLAQNQATPELVYIAAK
jgi:hypothetical protein